MVFEDLKSSKGTTVGDAALKGKLEFDGDSVEFKMGLSSEIFRSAAISIACPSVC